MAEAKPSGEPGWKWRRAVIFPVLLFAAWRLMMLEGADDTEINGTIAWGWFVLLYVLLLCYTGFATIQDVAAIWATRSGMPYAPQQPMAGHMAPSTVVVADTASVAAN